MANAERGLWSVLSEGMARASIMGSNPHITSSRDAYASLRKIYGYFSYFAPQPSFAYLTNPVNRVCQILCAHFVAMQLIMTPITRNEWVAREDKKKRTENEEVTARWFSALHRNVPAEWMPYYEWTMWVESEVAKGRVFNGLVEGENEEGAATLEEKPQGPSVNWDEDIHDMVFEERQVYLFQIPHCIRQRAIAEENISI
ncbi:hypothetical protein HYALB_00001102 [Hymenoscyphus albidus]|uniref:Uncharacterized protein n=1 Tax=Hymenoscyphus albidus TaxID=595503 RepID=A0A9N9LHG4_9HELO|nr:hypothetical protein HYALB_00001102 [Hymenoscyphus albidus]